MSAESTSCHTAPATSYASTSPRRAASATPSVSDGGPEAAKVSRQAMSEGDITKTPALTASWTARSLPMHATWHRVSLPWTAARRTLVASSKSNTRDRSRSTASTVAAPAADKLAMSHTRCGAAIWSAITSRVRSVTNERAARTDNPFGLSQAGLSKKRTSGERPRSDAHRASMRRRSSSPLQPTTIPTRRIPAPASTRSVRRIKGTPATAERQLGVSASATGRPRPAARIRA